MSQVAERIDIRLLNSLPMNNGWIYANRDHCSPNLFNKLSSWLIPEGYCIKGLVAKALYPQENCVHKAMNEIEKEDPDFWRELGQIEYKLTHEFITPWAAKGSLIRLIENFQREAA